MRKAWQAASKHPDWWAFLAALLLFGIHLAFSKFHALYYDSELYWRFAHDMEQDGKFSLFNMTSQMRGYLYPLLNYPLTALERSWLPGYQMGLVKTEGAVLAALLFGVVGPRCWQALTRQPVLLGRRLVFIALGFLFWRDHFNFLLSDFPALLFLLGGTGLVLRARHPAALLLGGFLLIGTIYIRPIYMLAVPCVLLFRLLRPQPAARGRQLAGWAALVVGALLVMAPQLALNLHNFDSASPFVLNTDKSGQYAVAGEDNLYLWHLNEGLGVQKYETNIGGAYPKAQVFYFDNAGRLVLANRASSQVTSLANYARLVAEHPLDMTALFCRHLFNGLDVLYSSPYLTRVYSPNSGLALLHYAVFFGALLLAVRRAPLLRPAHWLLVAALVLPTLASVPLVVECRFFISLHVLIYGLVCFGLPHPARWPQVVVPAWRLPLLVGFAVFMLSCVTLSASTRASLEVPVLPEGAPE
ncbi:hypothetical protein [Hymenobacter psychrophilus]|uniref:Dolichyl-phosphate-mannose-protein mannosyltransferase n=1 Tax=Hymenobacter psychrophilus TaxID=651662 RepID=A0A1H3D5S1_9BACT|nr:hypothetical protein [Hymenobacter psychrophilus]SDX61852.1 hypothetical protein SAMN04488069_102236 [Hymenobacter psychrophilus]